MSSISFNNYNFAAQRYLKSESTKASNKPDENEAITSNNTNVQETSSQANNAEESDNKPIESWPVDNYSYTMPKIDIGTELKKLETIFAYDGSTAVQNSSKLQQNFVIDQPLSAKFGIAEKSGKNSTTTGKGSYGTGRVDDYVATYDSEGRLSSIQVSNSKYGNTKYTYEYDLNGEMTETSVDDLTGVVIETKYNRDKTIQAHSEYMSMKAKDKGDSVITRKYQYGMDMAGNPIQVMNNSAGVTVTTTYVNGKYEEKVLSKDDKMKQTFSYYGQDVKTRSELRSDLGASFAEQFSIPSHNKNNSTDIGKIDYGTGRIDDYVATYDSEGKLTSIQTTNSQYGNRNITYTYDDRGNFTETLNDEMTGCIIEAKYSNGGLIQTYNEYASAKAKANGDSAVEKNYSYKFRDGYISQTVKNADGVTIKAATIDTRVPFKTEAPKNNADSDKLQQNFIIDRPISYKFGIAENGTANSTTTGKGNYGTGRVDDYVATYDSEGRLSSVKTTNPLYGNTEYTYTYAKNGEVTISSVDDLTGVVIETTYNKDKTLKTHSEYNSIEDKTNGKAVITRNYTYDVNSEGEPFQIMENSAGVKTVTYKQGIEYIQTQVRDDDEIQSAFGYDGKNSVAYNPSIADNVTLNKPVAFGHHIDTEGKANSTVVKDGYPGTGLTYVISYDSEGRLSSLKFNYAATPERNSTYTYTYADNGELIETMESEKYGYITEKTYNKNGTPKSEIQYENAQDKAKGIIGSMVPKYYSYYIDSNGNPVQKIVSKIDDRIFSTQTVTFANGYYIWKTEEDN